MTIKKVWIEPGSIGAGYCNELCSKVFGLDDFGESFIEVDADYNLNEKCIKQAATRCPVQVIRFEEE